ncbi:hypothetical protein B0H11DRAFT_1926275 [Mycena galericulata]|nr:hypothetical protein B0H11DRAFT_1926275 [Mycena galericulata]
MRGAEVALVGQEPRLDRIPPLPLVVLDRKHTRLVRSITAPMGAHRPLLLAPRLRLISPDPAVSVQLYAASRLVCARCALAYLAELVRQAAAVAPLARQVLAQHEPVTAAHVKLAHDAPQSPREALVPDAYLRHRAPVARRGSVSVHTCLLEHGLPLQREPLPAYAKVARDAPQQPRQALVLNVYRMRPWGAFAPRMVQKRICAHPSNAACPDSMSRYLCTLRARPAPHFESLAVYVKLMYDAGQRLREARSYPPRTRPQSDPPAEYLGMMPNNRRSYPQVVNSELKVVRDVDDADHAINTTTSSTPGRCSTQKS